MVVAIEQPHRLAGRPADKLARYPASTERVFKPAGCLATG